jgi:hypothetical protein
MRSYWRETQDKVGERVRPDWLRCSENKERKEMKPLDRITIDPQVCLGQPTIRGMRITVSVILKLVAGGMSRQ